MDHTTTHSSEKMTPQLSSCLAEALKLVPPSWPLQNTVAVNPFWFQTEQSFEQLLSDLAPVFQVPLFMPLSYYLHKFHEGAITHSALAEALANTPRSKDPLTARRPASLTPGDPQTPPTPTSARDEPGTIVSAVAEFLQGCQAQAEALAARGLFPCFQSWSEVYEPENRWAARISDSLGKFCAAYLDEQQALVRLPWQGLGFWQAWHSAQQHDLSWELAWGRRQRPRGGGVGGGGGWRQILAALQQHPSGMAIQLMLAHMGVSESAQLAYLQRLLATCLGWASQFRLAAWQKALGYPVAACEAADLQDLLAVRMAYDYALFCRAEQSKLDPAELAAQRRCFQESLQRHPGRDWQDFWQERCWQRAFELSYQSQIAEQLKTNDRQHQLALSSSNSADQIASGVEAQLVFCIDVRSEMLRRHLERCNPRLQTLGFAGFFGLPFAYQATGDAKASHRLPVLLAPAFQVSDPAGHRHDGGVVGDQGTKHQQPQHRPRPSFFVQLAGFLRSLRKNSFSSFVYVEWFGALYLEKLLTRTLLASLRRGLALRQSQLIPQRFQLSGGRGVQTTAPLPSSSSSPSFACARFALSASAVEKIERAAAVLSHLGLGTPLAPLVLLIGHGSVTTNNAFGSALDCGACGGHAGDVNARVLADLLNDPGVRAGLAAKGRAIPPTTWFVAGVHETVSDEVYVLEAESVPVAWQAALANRVQELAKASADTRVERRTARSGQPLRPADRRSADWAELRPEWGLAGNACFIVAPRHRTQGVCLGSRAFLHDYDWRKDAEQGYKTLELIMTAPMVVTHWINLQYYASTVAPCVFGAGSKVLHNLTNENAVVEGNGGDLRIGLPWQSVHDGVTWVHDPLRLSVFIEAPLAEIEKVIAKHEGVRHLVEHEWLHLFSLTPAEGLEEGLQVTARRPANFA